MNGCDMDLPTALGVADKYSKPGAGIGCLHSDAYKRLALEIRRIHNAKADGIDVGDSVKSLVETKEKL